MKVGKPCGDRHKIQEFFSGFPTLPFTNLDSPLTGLYSTPKQKSMAEVEKDRRVSPVLTSEQVANILGVSKRTLKNWLRSGKIPEPARNQKNNYREWNLADIETARHILRGMND